VQGFFIPAAPALQHTAGTLVPSMATRATPLSPDARRASIIAATLPLLRAHGSTVTTSQIAFAAGVAEGTLFRAFPDKDALIQATIQSAFDPAVTEQRLAAIDRTDTLRAQLVAAVEILKERVEQVWQLISAFNLPMPPKRPPSDLHTDKGIRDQLEALFVPHAAELRVDPNYAMRVMRSLAFAGTHPRISDNQPFTASEIVTILLEGIGRHDEEQ
jgi:AcrR family transcriptional regulator